MVEPNLPSNSILHNFCYIFSWTAVRWSILQRSLICPEICNAWRSSTWCPLLGLSTDEGRTPSVPLLDLSAPSSPTCPSCVFFWIAVSAISSRSHCEAVNSLETQMIQTFPDPLLNHPHTENQQYFLYQYPQFQYFLMFPWLMIENYMNYTLSEQTVKM